MRKLITAGLATATLAALLAGPVAAGDVKGPKGCLDIVNNNTAAVSDAVYDKTTETVSAQLALAATSCTDVFYTLYVYDEAGDASRIGTGVVLGDGQNAYVQILNVDASANGATDSFVCVVATSTWRGHVADRAPDSSCIVLTAGDGSGGNVGWR